MQILSSVIGEERQDICCIFKLQEPHVFCLAADVENLTVKMSDEFASYIVLSDCDPKPLHPLRVGHP